MGSTPYADHHRRRPFTSAGPAARLQHAPAEPALISISHHRGDRGSVQWALSPRLGQGHADTSRPSSSPLIYRSDLIDAAWVRCQQSVPFRLALRQAVAAQVCDQSSLISLPAASRWPGCPARPLARRQEVACLDPGTPSRNVGSARSADQASISSLGRLCQSGSVHLVVPSGSVAGRRQGLERITSHGPRPPPSSLARICS